MTLLAQVDIQNATVYDSDDIRAIFRAITDYSNALPRKYMSWRLDYSASPAVEVPCEYKRRGASLPDCPIRVRSYSPTNAQNYGDFYHDTEGECFIFKIQPPRKLPQNALIALAKCADGSEPSIDTRVLVALVNLIRSKRGLLDLNDANGRETSNHGAQIVAEFKLRLRYGDKLDATECKRQKIKDLVLRHTKLLKRRTWKLNEIYEVEKVLTRKRAEETDIKRKITDIERKLNEL